MLVYNTRHAEELVYGKEMDIGFVEGPLSGRDEIVPGPGSKTNFWYSVVPTDPLAHNEVFDINRDLKGKKWIMRESGSGTAATVRERFGKYMDDVNVVMEMGHPEAVKRRSNPGPA
jgi:hypothetical protein